MRSGVTHASALLLASLLIAGCAASRGGLLPAAREGDVRSLRAALAELGPDASADPAAEEALRAAAERGQLDSLRALLDAGVDPNAQDDSGKTPLHQIALAKLGPETAKLVALLAERGARIDARDLATGATPIVLAARATNVDATYAIARAGAQLDLAETGGRGETALHAAVAARARRVTRLLLQGGADPYAPDSRGDSPLARAMAGGDAELQTMFRLALAGRAHAIPLPHAREVETSASSGGATRFLTQRRTPRDEDHPAYSLADSLADAATPDATAAKPPSSSRPASTSQPASTPRTRRRSGFDARYRRRVAAVVGIDRYQRWPDLEGARRDSQRIADELRRQGFDEVLELYDGQATRSRILDLLGRQLAERTTQEDLAFIFFAGHGETETLPGGGKRGYIVPTDASPKAIYSTGISMATLRDLSGRLEAKHIFYAMDSCYSGLGLTRGVAVKTNPDQAYIEKMTSLRAVQMLTAGTEGELAIERDGQGLFTTYLIRALRGEADFDANGVVTAGEIGVFVRPQVSAASDNRQTPQFGTLEGAGEIVFPLSPLR